MLVFPHPHLKASERETLTNAPTTCRAFPKSSNGAQVVTVAGGFNLLSVEEGGIVNHLIARFLQRSLSDA